MSQQLHSTDELSSSTAQLCSASYSFVVSTADGRSPAAMKDNTKSSTFLSLVKCISIISIGDVEVRVEQSMMVYYLTHSIGARSNFGRGKCKLSGLRTKFQKNSSGSMVRRTSYVGVVPDFGKYLRKYVTERDLWTDNSNSRVCSLYLHIVQYYGTSILHSPPQSPIYQNERY